MSHERLNNSLRPSRTRWRRSVSFSAKDRVYVIMGDRITTATLTARSLFEKYSWTNMILQVLVTIGLFNKSMITSTQFLAFLATVGHGTM